MSKWISIALLVCWPFVQVDEISNRSTLAVMLDPHRFSLILVGSTAIAWGVHAWFQQSRRQSRWRKVIGVIVEGGIQDARIQYHAPGEEKPQFVHLSAFSKWSVGRNVVLLCDPERRNRAVPANSTAHFWAVGGGVVALAIAVI